MHYVNPRELFKRTGGGWCFIDVIGYGRHPIKIPRQGTRTIRYTIGAVVSRMLLALILPCAVVRITTLAHTDDTLAICRVFAMPSASLEQACPCCCRPAAGYYSCRGQPTCCCTGQFPLIQHCAFWRGSRLASRALPRPPACSKVHSHAPLVRCEPLGLIHHTYKYEHCCRL